MPSECFIRNHQHTSGTTARGKRVPSSRQTRANKAIPLCSGFVLQGSAFLQRWQQELQEGERLSASQTMSMCYPSQRECGKTTYGLGTRVSPGTFTGLWHRGRPSAYENANPHQIFTTLKQILPTGANSWQKLLLPVDFPHLPQHTCPNFALCVHRAPGVPSNTVRAADSRRKKVRAKKKPVRLDCPWPRRKHYGAGSDIIQLCSCILLIPGCWKIATNRLDAIPAGIQIPTP